MIKGFQLLKGVPTKEMVMKSATLVATIFLTLISVMQLLRFALHVQVTVSGIIVPTWLSAVACVFTGGLAIMLWLENRQK